MKIYIDPGTPFRIPVTQNPERHFQKLRDTQLVDYNTIHIKKGAKYIDNGRHWLKQRGYSKHETDSDRNTFTKWKL